MKKITSILCCLLFSCVLAFAGDPPVATQNNFKQKFPAVEKVKWEKEKKGGYEASFKSNGVKYSALFSDNGEWLQTETDLGFKNLPNNVKKSFSKTYLVGSAKGASKIETSKGDVKYEVEFRPGNRMLETYFLEDGTEVSGE